MKKGMAKAVAFCLAAGLTYTGMGASAFAAGAADTSIVGTRGFAVCDSQINVRASGDTEGEVVGVLSNKDAVEIEDVDENGWYRIRSGNVEGYVAGQFIATGSEADAIAQTAGYTTAEVGAKVLNIRSSKSTDSAIVATAEESDALEVVQDDGDWVKVCIDHDTYGWVSCDYVYTSTEYGTGETIDEVSQQAAAAEAQASDAAYEQTADATYEQTSDAAYEQTADATYEQTSAAAYEQPAEESYDAGTYTETAESDVLYQQYLTAQEAAMHPTSSEEAQRTADEAIAAYQAYLQSIGVSNAGGSSDNADAGSETPQETYTEPAAQQTSQGGTDADYLYQAYLQAQDAANHPTDEADANAKAAAAIEAYNAYLNAIGAQTAETGGETVPQDTPQTEAPQTEAPQTEAPQTEAPQTEAPQTEAPQTEAPSSSLGEQIAAYAQQFVGNPYVYGGASLTGGADCSGFTMAVFAHFGIGLPHNAAAQSGCGTQVSLSDIQPGDLLFYDNGGGIGHVTIYIGNGQVCHASNERTGITISSISYRNPVCAVRAW